MVVWCMDLRNGIEDERRRLLCKRAALVEFGFVLDLDLDLDLVV